MRAANRIVAPTAQMIKRIVPPPRPKMMSALMRAPSKSTPARKTVRETKAIPGAAVSSAPKKFKAMPKSNA